MRFVMTTLCGIGWSTIILWLASNALHPFLINTTVWANASKVIAIAGTALINYLGMRLWVFVQSSHHKQRVWSAFFQRRRKSSTPKRAHMHLPISSSNLPNRGS